MNLGPCLDGRAKITSESYYFGLKRNVGGSNVVHPIPLELPQYNQCRIDERMSP